MGIWKRRVDRSARVPAPPAPAAPPARPRPDFLAANSTVRASLGSETEVSGRLSFSAPTRIDGKLHGEVRATETLVIGETGFVEGTVRATHLVILGHVQGEVLGAERVEIGPLGILEGVIETRALVVQRGGRLEGDCRIMPARPRVHLLHARSEPGNGTAGAGAGKTAERA